MNLMDMCVGILMKFMEFMEDMHRSQELVRKNGTRILPGEKLCQMHGFKERKRGR